MDLDDKMSWCGGGGSASSNARAHIGSLAQSVSGMLVRRAARGMCHVSENRERGGRMDRTERCSARG
jgi:hypothetical protein